jgi:hypothetical protein
MPCSSTNALLSILFALTDVEPKGLVELLDSQLLRYPFWPASDGHSRTNIVALQKFQEVEE